MTDSTLDGVPFTDHAGREFGRVVAADKPGEMVFGLRVFVTDRAVLDEVKQWVKQNEYRPVSASVRGRT